MEDGECLAEWGLRVQYGSEVRQLLPHPSLADHDIALVKKDDPKALLFPTLEVNVPTKLIRPTRKAVVMSSKPAFEYCGKDVKWMTIGSPARALEVILETDHCIKVHHLE